MSDGSAVGGVENTCLSAHERKAGESLNFVKEEYKAKAILYRWK